MYDTSVVTLELYGLLPTNVSLNNGLDHGLRFARSIVRLNKEVRRELWDVQDFGNPALPVELNNPSRDTVLVEPR